MEKSRSHPAVDAGRAAMTVDLRSQGVRMACVVVDDQAKCSTD